MGPFDTDLRGYGMDLDWCWSARQAAWGCLVDHGARVFHESGATRKRVGGQGIDRNELMDAALRRNLAQAWQERVWAAHCYESPIEIDGKQAPQAMLWLRAVEEAVEQCA